MATSRTRPEDLWGYLDHSVPTLVDELAGAKPAADPDTPSGLHFVRREGASPTAAKATKCRAHCPAERSVDQNSPAYKKKTASPLDLF
jgi:hypothetical protein